MAVKRGEARYEKYKSQCKKEDATLKRRRQQSKERDSKIRKRKQNENGRERRDGNWQDVKGARKRKRADKRQATQARQARQARQDKVVNQNENQGGQASMCVSDQIRTEKLGLGQTRCFLTANMQMVGWNDARSGAGWCGAGAFRSEKREIEE